MATTPLQDLIQACKCTPPMTSNVKFHFKCIPQTVGLESVLNNITKRIALVYPRLEHTLVYKRNFAVLKLNTRDNLVYTIFPRSGHVNVTGVKNFNHIPRALHIFNKLFGACVLQSDVTVDNSTSSGQLESGCKSSRQADNPTGKSHRSPASVLKASEKQKKKKKKTGGWTRVSRARAPSYPQRKPRLDLVRLKQLIDSEGDPQQVRLSLRPHFFPGAVLRRRQQNGSVILFNTAKYVVVGAKNRRQVEDAHKFACAITSELLKTNTPETLSA
ncbi:MAG: hypothetical protein MI867_07585 [Pseudomonadales bacterium]|nr:hypothetical protein [Pseudomonadales bacterium]